MRVDAGAEKLSDPPTRVLRGRRYPRRDVKCAGTRRVVRAPGERSPSRNHRGRHSGLPGPPGGTLGPAGPSPPVPGWQLAYSSAEARAPASASSIPAGVGVLLFRPPPALPFGFAAAARRGR